MPNYRTGKCHARGSFEDHRSAFRRKMGRRINDYMVEFRKSIHNDKVKTILPFTAISRATIS